MIVFCKLIISVGGGHCDYSPWAPPPPKKNLATPLATPT